MKHAILAVVSLFLINTVAANVSREVVGYYAGWKWYKRDKLVNPQTIDYSRYSIINYAFFKPLENGSITEGDAWADKNILIGKAITVNGKTQYDHSTSLVYNARLNGVKVVGSIGGWTWSSVFPGIAGDPMKRKKFAASCIGMIKKYDLDGIDIDWEYPGFASHNGSPEDKKHFTLLLADIRKALDDHGNSIGKKYMLTAAFGPAPDHMRQIEWDKVAGLLDLIHVMTYNYYGSWDRITNHNAPLYAPKYGNPEYNINSSISRLTELYKVDRKKITLGVAFYGRSVITMSEPSLHGISTGKTDAETFPEEKGTPSYYNIAGKLKFFNLHRDPAAGVPYMIGKNGVKCFVSFDDPVSIRQKADYVNENELRGLVIWDISGDYIETYPGSGILAGNPLCDAIAESFELNNSVASHFTASDNDIPVPIFGKFVTNRNIECPVMGIPMLHSHRQGLYQINRVSEKHVKINSTMWSREIFIVRWITPDDDEIRQLVKL